VIAVDIVGVHAVASSLIPSPPSDALQAELHGALPAAAEFECAV
jgi:hypothetical protein